MALFILQRCQFGIPPRHFLKTLFYNNTDLDSLLISERKKDPSLEATDDKSIQDWDLKDVIFVEDKRNIPVGKVLKVCFIFVAYILLLCCLCFTCSSCTS